MQKTWLRGRFSSRSSSCFLCQMAMNWWWGCVSSNSMNYWKSPFGKVSFSTRAIFCCSPGDNTFPDATYSKGFHLTDSFSELSSSLFPLWEILSVLSCAVLFLFEGYKPGSLWLQPFSLVFLVKQFWFCQQPFLSHVALECRRTRWNCLYHGLSFPVVLDTKTNELENL